MYSPMSANARISGSRWANRGSPRTIAESALVRDAVRMVRENRQDEIPVVDAAGQAARAV